MQVYTDAARTQQVATTTVNIPSNKRNVYFSTQSNGGNNVTQIDEGQTVYIVHTYESMADGTPIATWITIADQAATITNGHVSNDQPASVNVNNGKAIWTLNTKLDGQNTGNLSIKAHDAFGNVLATCTLRDQDVPTTVTIVGNKENLDLEAYFLSQKGRLPSPNEQVIFVMNGNVVFSYDITRAGMILSTWSSNRAPIVEVKSGSYLYGAGGRGGGFILPDGGLDYLPQNGGVAVENRHPSVGLIINNYGQVGGGGGAPYGKGGYLADTAVLSYGGWAGTMPGYNYERRAGNGGDWGMPGTGCTDFDGWNPGGDAGFIKVGNVTINTLGSGETRGR